MPGLLRRLNSILHGHPQSVAQANWRVALVGSIRKEWGGVATNRFIS